MVVAKIGGAVSVVDAVAGDNSIQKRNPDKMKKLYIALTAVCMLAMTTEAQQRPGGGRPGGGQGGPGGGGPFGGGGQDWRQRMEEFRRNAGGREGIGEMFRAMREGGAAGGTIQDRMAEGARRMGVTFNEAPTMRMSMFDVVERIGGARAQ